MGLGDVCPVDLLAQERLVVVHGQLRRRDLLRVEVHAGAADSHESARFFTARGHRDEQQRANEDQWPSQGFPRLVSGSVVHRRSPFGRDSGFR